MYLKMYSKKKLCIGPFSALWFSHCPTYFPLSLGRLLERRTFVRSVSCCPHPGILWEYCLADLSVSCCFYTGPIKSAALSCSG